MTEIHEAAEKWVFDTNTRWSNNNNEAGDNYGSFIEGAKFASKAIISYIENDAEIAIPIERFFDEYGMHITKNQYGKVLLEILCEELRSKFIGNIHETPH